MTRYQLPDRAINSIVSAVNVAVTTASTTPVTHAHITGTLYNEIVRPRGRPGLFWLCIALAHVVVFGAVTDPAGPGRFLITEVQPGRLADFLGAVAAAGPTGHFDRFADAADAFDRLLPAGGGLDDTVRVVANLFPAAVDRVAGRTV